MEITLASGGRLWRIRTPGFELSTTWNNCWINGEKKIDFDVAAGVRQRCVLNPRLLRSILDWALSKWRAQLHGVGYNVQVGGVAILDLRFADNTFLFAKSYQEIGHVLDMLVDALRHGGFVLKAVKTKTINHAEPTPS